MINLIPYVRPFLRLLTCLFCFLLSGARAQDPVYRVYDRRDGLPSNTVYCAFQDARGFLWFGTDAGASRFDGRAFRGYNVQNGLVDSEVLRIYQDSKGRIWFLTLKGLLCYYLDGKIHNPYNDPDLPKGLADRGLLSFREDAKGNIWFGGLSNQVLRIDPSDHCDFIMPDTIANPARAGWTFLYEPEPGVMIVNVQDGLVRINSDDLKETPVEMPGIGDTVAWMENTGPRTGLLISTRGLFRLNGYEAELLLSAAEIPAQMNMGRITQDEDGSLWMMNNDKCVYYLKKTPGGFAPALRYFTGQVISRVYNDREGNRWFTTIGNGVYKSPANNPQISAQYIPNDEHREQVFSIIAARDGSQWIGTSNGSVYHREGGRLSRFDLLKENNTINRVLSLLEDSTGNILCAADRGLFLLARRSDGSYEEARPIPSIEGFEVAGLKRLFRDRNGTNYTSSLTGIRPVIQRNGRLYQGELTHPDINFRVYAPFFASDGRLWFEHFERLSYLEGDKVREFPQFDSLFISRITVINETDDGCLLIGTYGRGLYVMKNDAIIFHADYNSLGLTGDHCTKLVRREGKIFLATTNGVNILQWDGASLHLIEKFANRDGLLNEYTNDLAIDNRYLYLATPDGVCTIDRIRKKTKALPPTTYITDFEILGQSVSLKAPIVVQPDSNSIGLTYIAPTFDQPHLMQFRYRFLPDDEEWTVAATTGILISDMDPGYYRFEVQAKKFNSDWGPTAFLEFRILPPFYKTLAFRILMIALAVGLAFLLIRRIIARRYQKQFVYLREQQALEVERRRIGADMHDDLGADLTNILIYSKIISSAEALNERQRGALKKIGETSNDLINKMNEIIWALNPSNDTLDNLIAYLRQYAYDFCELHNLPLQIESSPQSQLIPIKAAVRRNLFLVLKEALRNVLRHARAHQVKVHIVNDATSRSLLLLIEDDGNGIDRSKPKHGNGLVNMQKRIAEIGGTISIDSPGTKGTRIQVQVHY